MNKDTRIIALGDIHGCFHSLKELIENRIQLTKDDQLILLGDYIDRGMQSKEVVDYIIELQRQGFNIITLMGNHEMLLLNAYQDHHGLAKWFVNGGRKTLESFGLESISELGEKYIRFFKGLKLFYEIDNFLFVHAGFNNVIEDPFSDTFFMLSKCRPFYTHSLLKDKHIIHGHCPNKITNLQKAIERGSKIINIDTGCVYEEHNGYGHLSAYSVKDSVLYFV